MKNRRRGNADFYRALAQKSWQARRSETYNWAEHARRGWETRREKARQRQEEARKINETIDWYDAARLGVCSW